MEVRVEKEVQEKGNYASLIRLYRREPSIDEGLQRITDHFACDKETSICFFTFESKDHFIIHREIENIVQELEMKKIKCLKKEELQKKLQSLRLQQEEGREVQHLITTLSQYGRASRRKSRLWMNDEKGIGIKVEIKDEWIRVTGIINKDCIKKGESHRKDSKDNVKLFLKRVLSGLNIGARFI